MKKGIAYLILSLYTLIMSYYLYTHQYYNADIEAYMGLVYKANHPEMKIEEIHQKVYTELRGKNPKLFEVSVGREEEAIGENSYYKTLSENPKAYEEELQLFSVKPFYNFINSIFFKLGFPASTSTFLITITSYILIVFLIFVFLSQILKSNFLALTLTLLLSLFKPLLDTSRHATPDALSCILLLLSIYFVARKRNLFMATVLGMLCILTRPEYFIFYTLSLVILYIFKNEFRIKTKELVFSFIYLFLSFALVQYFNQISWSVLFMNQFTKVQIYPISHPDPFNFHEYLSFVKSKIFFEFNTSYFVLLAIFIIVIADYKLVLKKNPKTILFLSFMGIIYLTVFIRFLLFPVLVNRMMVGFYLLIILSLIAYQSSKKEIAQSLP